MRSVGSITPNTNFRHPNQCPSFSFPSLHIILSQNVHNSLYIYIYAVRHTHWHSLTARRIQTLLCYASSCYYHDLTYPSVMDFFLHAPYIRSLLFLFFFPTYSCSPSGLSWGLQEGLSLLFFSLSLLWYFFFLFSARHGS